MTLVEINSVSTSIWQQLLYKEKEPDGKRIRDLIAEYSFQIDGKVEFFLLKAGKKEYRQARYLEIGGYLSTLIGLLGVVGSDLERKLVRQEVVERDEIQASLRACNVIGSFYSKHINPILIHLSNSTVNPSANPLNVVVQKSYSVAYRFLSHCISHSNREYTIVLATIVGNQWIVEELLNQDPSLLNKPLKIFDRELELLKHIFLKDGLKSQQEISGIDQPGHINEAPLLHWAAIFNQSEMMKFLIQRGCRVMAYDEYDRTALTFLINKKYSLESSSRIALGHCIEVLLNAGMDLELTRIRQYRFKQTASKFRSDGKSPTHIEVEGIDNHLHQMVRTNNLSLMTLFVSEIKKKLSSTLSTIFPMISEHSMEIIEGYYSPIENVKLLLLSNSSPAADCVTLLSLSIKRLNIPMLQYLLDQGLNPLESNIYVPRTMYALTQSTHVDAIQYAELQEKEMILNQRASQQDREKIREIQQILRNRK